MTIRRARLECGQDLDYEELRDVLVAAEDHQLLQDMMPLCEARRCGPRCTER